MLSRALFEFSTSRANAVSEEGWSPYAKMGVHNGREVPRKKLTLRHLRAPEPKRSRDQARVNNSVAAVIWNSDIRRGQSRVSSERERGKQSRCKRKKTGPTSHSTREWVALRKYQADNSRGLHSRNPFAVTFSMWKKLDNLANVPPKPTSSRQEEDSVTQMLMRAIRDSSHEKLQQIDDPAPKVVSKQQLSRNTQRL